MAPRSLCHQGDPPKPVAAGERGPWDFAIQPGSFFGHPKCKGWLSWQQATAGNKENCSRSARTILTKDFFLLYVFFFYPEILPVPCTCCLCTAKPAFWKVPGVQPSSSPAEQLPPGQARCWECFFGDVEDLGTSYVTSFPCPRAPPALGCGQVRLQDDQSSPVTVGEVEIKLQEGENQILPMGIHHFSRFHVP